MVMTFSTNTEPQQTSNNVIKEFYVKENDTDVTKAQLQIDAHNVFINNMPLDDYLNKYLDKLWKWVADSQLYTGNNNTLVSDDLSFLWLLKQVIELKEDNDNHLINEIKIKADSRKIVAPITFTQTVISVSKDDNDASLWNMVQSLRDEDIISELQPSSLKIYNSTSYYLYDEVYYAVGDKNQAKLGEGKIFINALVPNSNSTSNTTETSSGVPAINLNYALVSNGMFK